jgi:hypothetical protein
MDYSTTRDTTPGAAARAKQRVESVALGNVQTLLHSTMSGLSAGWPRSRAYASGRDSGAVHAWPFQEARRPAHPSAVAVPDDQCVSSRLTHSLLCCPGAS